MLFADAVGYSRLSEDQIPLFFDCYAGAVARYNSESPYKAVHVETAGDGMYMVFDEPGTAGHYALGLSERINQEDWEARGLPADLNVRIGLHCGPVFVGRDFIPETTRVAPHASSRSRRPGRCMPAAPSLPWQQPAASNRCASAI